MRKIGYLIIAIFLLVSCSDKDGIPSGIMGKEKMRKVFWEMVQQDIFVNQFIKKDSTKNPVQQSIQLQNKIFLLNHITKDDFFKSYKYYQNHPDLMNVLLDSVYATSERERTKFYQKK